MFCVWNCGCLNLCFHYTEREISLQNQVKCWKNKLDLCKGRLACYSSFFLLNTMYITLFSGVPMSVVFKCTFGLQNKRNKRQSAKMMLNTGKAHKASYIRQ